MRLNCAVISGNLAHTKTQNEKHGTEHTTNEKKYIVIVSDKLL